jgi:hypothetical protein
MCRAGGLSVEAKMSGEHAGTGLSVREFAENTVCLKMGNPEENGMDQTVISMR